MQLIDKAIISGATQSSCCELLNISSRTYRRWKNSKSLLDRRQTTHNSPPNKLLPSERLKILEVSNSSEFCNLPPCQIVPRLADSGKYIASESTFYRILRAENQLRHRGRSKARKHSKPRELIANKPNKVWCTDISYLPTFVGGMFFYLYFIIDIYSRKIISFSVENNESSEHVSRVVKEGYHIEKIVAKQVSLHSDNGAPMKGSTLIETLNKLKVFYSYSRPSVSNDNPYIESLFKTTKYSSRYPGRFHSIENAREWVAKFVKWYNEEHLHSGLKFISPNQRHQRLDSKILNNRMDVYNKARKQHPERWAGAIRNWKLEDTVVLNPNKEITTTSKSYKLAA